MMETLLRDGRHAIRGLARSPGFAISVVMLLALGIGVNTTIFAWLDSLVRHPLPGIPDARELVVLNAAERDGRVDGMPPVAYPVLEEWRARASSFSGIAAHAQTRLNLRLAPAGRAESVWVELAAADFFGTLGVAASRGRVFDGHDEAVHAAVVVVSHAFWQRRMGGAIDAVGRSLLLNGVPFTVIGIAPPRFTGVVTGLAFEAWVPLWRQPALIAGTDWMRDRTARRLQAIARLRPGARLTDATRELNDVAREVSRSYGESPITGAAARWISDTQLGSLMRPLGVAMLAVTAIVLMTVCLNVASLLLTRALGNERQTAIRIAIGASRAQLVRSSLVQHGVLAMLGCAFGVVFAQMTKGALMVLVPQVALPVSLEVDVNWRVAAFAVAISMVSAMLFAIVPALGASRADVVEALRSASTTATGRLGARRALVVAQVALSFAAIVIAGLFLRSVQTAARAPLGFGDPRQVLLLSTDLSFTRLDGQRLANLIDQTLESVRQLPGVDHAALSNMVPLGFGPIPRVTTRIDGYVPAPDESMSIARAIVSDGYFDAMQIPIVHGRGVSRTDRSGAARVAVINEAMAARYWPGQESIGNRIDQGSGWAVIVGVVRDSALDSMTEPPGPMIYFPWAQMPANALSLYVRSRGNPLLLVEPVRNTLSAVNRELPVLDPRLLADAMGAATFVQSVGASVFSVFGMLSLIVTAAGLYGVVAQFVAERRKEIAILVALGATPGGVAKAILGPALQVTLWGLGLGVSLAVACTPLVRGHLAGIAPLDAISIAAAGVVMTIASVTSCAWPLWRALRIDPVITIREAS